MLIFNLKNRNQPHYRMTVKRVNEEMKKKPGFVRYYSPTCPHCVNMENDWNHFEETLRRKYPSDNGTVLVSSQPECMKDLDFFNSPRGFPGLYSVNGNDVEEFSEGERNSDNFIRFYENEILSKAKKTTTKSKPKAGKKKQSRKIKKKGKKSRSILKRRNKRSRLSKKGGKKTRRVRFRI